MEKPNFALGINNKRRSVCLERGRKRGFSFLFLFFWGRKGEVCSERVVLLVFIHAPHVDSKREGGLKRRKSDEEDHPECWRILRSYCRAKAAASLCL